MPTISSYTAERIAEIEAATIVGGEVDVNGDLILTRFDGVEINAGSVVGPMGPAGATVIAFQEFALAPGSAVASLATFEDVHSSIEIPFVAPASGKVEVEVTALAWLLWGNQTYFWALREAGIKISREVIVLTQGEVRDSVSTPPLPPFASGFTGDPWILDDVGGQRTVKFNISGLVSGSSHTYRLAHRLGNANGYNANVVWSNADPFAPVSMKVTALP